MSDKEKIRAEIERRYNERDRIGDNIRANVHKSLISFIDSMQEEPVSIWHSIEELSTAREYEYILVTYKDTTAPCVAGNKTQVSYFDRVDKWAYLDDVLNLSNVERTIKDWKEEPLSKEIGDYDHKAVMESLHPELKEEPVSDDLEEAAHQYYEPNDKFMDGFKKGAKWQKEQFEKDYAYLCNGIVTAKGIAVTMAYDKGMADAKEKLMEKAVETTFNVSLPSGLYDKLWIKGCKDWDKLLVIKKDEL